MYQKKQLMLLFCSTFVSPFIMGKTVETTNNQQPTTNNQQPTTNNQQPTTNNQQPTTNNQQPTTNNQQPTKIYCPKLLFMATIINRFLPLKRSLLTR
ncbi:hypothetical protein [Haemophilus influenzae]|uniref:hypothetical protein n=1 Tax=Haemophilus influenzae TaxID=727 RepID=UPI00186480E0|nr:hypothetical protein [Haemophilus influenzae]